MHRWVCQSRWIFLNHWVPITYRPKENSIEKPNLQLICLKWISLLGLGDDPIAQQTIDYVLLFGGYLCVGYYCPVSR